MAGTLYSFTVFPSRSPPDYNISLSRFPSKTTKREMIPNHTNPSTSDEAEYQHTKQLPQHSTRRLAWWHSSSPNPNPDPSQDSMTLSGFGFPLMVGSLQQPSVFVFFFSFSFFTTKPTSTRFSILVWPLLLHPEGDFRITLTTSPAWTAIGCKQH